MDGIATNDPKDPPSLSERMHAAEPDAKVRTILTAGYACFLQYGLRRTSMQDIADEAEMSRAALYLHFKNKNDIFRALMVAYYGAATDAVRDALMAHDDPGAALRASFSAQLGDSAEALMRSAHAEELLSVKHGAARAAVEAGQHALVEVYADWLGGELMAGRVAPEAVAGNPRETAAVILAALNGLKYGIPDWEAYVAARARLAELFGRALRVG